MKDALNRRSRFAPPQPGPKFSLKDGDYAILQFLGRHGKLHALYLYEAAKHLRTNYTYTVKRLGELYNGYVERGKHVTFITRDHDQFVHFNAHHIPVVHEVIEPTTKYRLPRSGSFIHDFFSSCFTASAELTDTRFIFRDDIIDHDSFKGDKKHPFSLIIDSRELQPDDIFGLLEEGKRRIFLLEADCATERVATADLTPSSITKKLKLYVSALDSGLMKAHFGFARPRILFATNAPGRVKTICDAFKALPEKYHDLFLVKAFPDFARKNWKIPSELLDVWTGWHSANGVVDINKKTAA